MKKLSLLLLVLVSTVVLAACGGGNAPANNAPVKDKDKGHKDHGHEHHGERHDLGKKKIGDMEVGVVHIHDDKKPNEAVFEIKTGLAADKNKDLKVMVWLGDQDGKELSPRKQADYAKDHNDFDAHCEMPKDKPKKAWVWVEITGNKAGYEVKLDD